MRKLLLPLLIATCIAGLAVHTASAQRRTTVTASRNYITRDLGNMDAVDEIELHGSPDVEFRQTTGRGTTVRLYGSDNLLEYLHVEKVGRRLVVRMNTPNNFIIRGERRLKVVVSGPTLVKASIAGSGDIDLGGRIETRKLELSVTGSGDIEFGTIVCDDLAVSVRGSGDVSGRSVKTRGLVLAVNGSGDIGISDVDAASANISVTGSGDIEVGGRSANAKLMVRGSDDLDAYRLRADNVEASVAGSGDLSCWAGKSLRATASGSGSIVYGGNPVTTHLNGRKGSIVRK